MRVITRGNVFFVGGFIIVTLLLVIGGYVGFIWTNPNSTMQRGEVLDSFNGVNVYYNGGVNQSSGQEQTPDGYRLGLKYQSIEFVKRYYYQRFGHRMSNAWGHAKDFFDKTIPDGQKNRERNLIQFTSPSKTCPQAEDLIIFGPTLFNPYGHVAIVTQVANERVEIIQQNPGPFAPTRESYPLQHREDGLCEIVNYRVYGWLRLPQNDRPKSLPPTEVPPRGLPPPKRSCPVNCPGKKKAYRKVIIKVDLKVELWNPCEGLFLNFLFPDLFDGAAHAFLIAVNRLRHFGLVAS